MIPYGKHCVDESDVQAVCDVLRNGWLTQGPLIPEFERAVANYVGSRYAVAVSSLTAGLHLGCVAAGLKKEDILITSPMSFCASANCALYVGARPVFSDIDPETSLMSPADIERKIKEMGGAKVLLPVHYGGLSCDMEAISAIAKKNDCIVIEDAAQAFGATHTTGERVGSCKYSLMTGFSFHPVKSIAAGEGGMICTNDSDIYQQLLRLRSHGINKGSDSLIYQDEAFTDGELNPWYHEMQQLGFNYRITDIQCALGISQLKKIDEFMRRRREIASYYDQSFAECENFKMTQDGCRELSANHLYVIRVNFDKLGMSKKKVFDRLKEQGIISQVHYIPIPMHPFYREHCPTPTEDYREALLHYREALSLPLFPSMPDEQVEKVIKSVKQVIG